MFIILVINLGLFLCEGILSSRVHTSRNKNSDNMLLKLTISLYFDSTVSSALNFYFYPFYCNPKEKNHIRKKRVKNKYLHINQYYDHFDLPKFRVRLVHTTKN